LSERRVSRRTPKKSSGVRLTIPYAKEESNIFENVLRPRLSIEVYSEFLSDWITIDDVLADTGADLSVLPKSLGVLVVGDIRKGKKYRITGLAGYSKYIYFHRLTTRIGHKKVKAAFAIAATDDIPPTLGRIDALDKMNIEYQKGRRMVISW
jgi:hypothetical protein